MPSISATSIVLETLQHALAAEEVGPVALAFSGGRDSTVLLWALVQCVGARSVVALHVDHGWRSAEERNLEKSVVEAQCQRLGVGLVGFRPPAEVVRSEAAARAHRFTCFASYLTDHPETRIFLAHHADDQAETVLMRLLKGRSWQGLQGMPSRRGPYRRPLLGLRSSVLAEAAQELGLVWHEDSTNADTSLTRNLLRQSVMPLLHQRFPRAVESLNEFARAWAEVAPTAALDPSWVKTEDGWAVPASRWDRWRPLARQTQLLSVVSRQPDSRGVSRRFLELVCRDHHSRRSTGAGWRWQRRGPWIEWAPWSPSHSGECWIQPERNRWYDLGTYRWCWSEEGEGTLALPCLDPRLPWVWRTAPAGSPLGSEDNPSWGKTTRRHRLGTSPEHRNVVVMQGGLVRAVVDPRAARLVWVETGSGKLHKGGIFVTLIAVTPNLTE